MTHQADRDVDVLERALISVRAGNEDAFEAAYAKAVAYLRGAAGCRDVRLLRGVEDPSTYLLLVRWATLEDHTVGFRQSAAFGQWRALLGEHFASPPQVEHYQPLADATGLAPGSSNGEGSGGAG